MKKVTLILFVFMSYSLTYGQDLNESKIEKVESKYTNFETTKALVQSKNFIFKMDWNHRKMKRHLSTSEVSDYLYFNNDNMKGRLKYNDSKDLYKSVDNNIIFNDEISSYKVYVNNKRKTVRISYQIKYRANVFTVNMFINSEGETEIVLGRLGNSQETKYYGKISTM